MNKNAFKIDLDKFDKNREKGPNILELHKNDKNIDFHKVTL